MDMSKWELLGSGAEADIYLCEGKAIKVFKSMRTLSGASQEADLQAKAFRAGLSVPAVYDVCEIEGKPAFIMEYVRGKTLGEAMLNDMNDATSYMQISVNLQIKVHEIVAHGFPSQKESLSANISATKYLSRLQKQDLLQQLQSLETGKMLCHGDFHVLNLISTGDDIKIIDWVCSTAGSVSADVCRTYLLYLLYRPEISELYLNLYCRNSKIPKQDVLAWLPVISGARLNENATEKDIILLLELVDGK